MDQNGQKMDQNDQNDVIEIQNQEKFKKFKKITQEAILSKKGWFKILYNDEDERRPDIDIIPYFFFNPLQRYDKKYNRHHLSQNNNQNVKIEPILEQKHKKLPQLEYLTEDQSSIVFQKRNVTIKSGRKAHMVKIGKVLLIAIIILTKGFGFCFTKDFFFERCQNIKLCRKQYKAIIQRIITTVWKKLERVIRKYCKYNITPFTNEQIRILFNPIQNMKEKLKPECRETFMKLMKVCFQLDRAIIQKQEAIILYKAVRKILHSDPLYIQMKQNEASNEGQNSSHAFPRFGARKGKKKTNMFHKTYILRHLQHEIEAREYNELLDEIMEEVKNNEDQEQKLASGRYSYDEMEFRAKGIQQKQFKLKVLKQLQLIASALYYKGWGFDFYIQYIQQISEDPNPEFLEIESSQYNKHSKIVMKKLFQKLQDQIKKQKRRIVQFNGDEQKQIINILLNYKMALNIRAGHILKNYLVKIFNIELEEGLLVDHISDAEALFLYKTILQVVNAKPSQTFLNKPETEEPEQTKKDKKRKPVSVFSDVFGQNKKKQEFKRERNEQNLFLDSKGISLNEFQNSLIELFLDQRETKKVLKYMNARYPKGQEFTLEMIINKLSQLLYRGILRAEMQRTKYTEGQIPEMSIPSEEQCKMMTLSPGYIVLKANVFLHILKQEHFDLNHLYFVVNTVNDGYEKLKIEIGKSEKLSKRKQNQDQINKVNKKNEDEEMDAKKTQSSMKKLKQNRDKIKKAKQQQVEDNKNEKDYD